MGARMCLVQLALLLSLFVVISLAQSSKSCETAIFLPPPYADTTVVGTTVDAQWSDDHCFGIYRAMTYRITPTVGNEVTITNCGPAANSPLLIEVYTGSCEAPECLLFSMVDPVSSCASYRDPVYMSDFVAEEAQYWVTVSTVYFGEYSFGGPFSININEDTYMSPVDYYRSTSPTAESYHWDPPAPPAGNAGSSCSEAISVTYGQSDAWSNTGIVYDNLCGLYTSSGTRWFVFSPNYNDRVKVDVCTTNFDTVLAVVDSCNSLGCIASNDDGCNYDASYVVVNVVAGRDYLICVGGWSTSTGNFRLNIASY